MRSFWKHSDEITLKLRSSRLLVTLDFDGTLAALAETPAKARLRPEFRESLRRLARAQGVSVFILSGRALADLRALVGLRGLYYGGNHGIEIEGPGFSWRDAAAARAKALVAGVAAGLRERFPPGTGVLVEDKSFTASVHYRALKKPYRTGFFARMRALMSVGEKGLRWSRGHKVFELRPAGAPHKGDAVLRLCKKVSARAALAVGDDLTDEDMFRAPGGAITVRVGRKSGSAAAYFVTEQADVLRLLEFVASVRRVK